MRLEEGSCWSSSGYVQISHLKETKAEQKDVGVGGYQTQGHPDPQAGRQDRRNGREGRALMF